jgi:hypothetical protein
MHRDCVRESKRSLSTDERAKERKKSQMQAASRGQHRPTSATLLRNVSIPQLAHRYDEGATEAAPVPRLCWLGSGGCLTPLGGRGIERPSNNSQEMIERKRLADERGTHSHPVRMACAHQDDGGAVPAGYQPRCQIDPVEFRHPNIAQDQVGRVAPHLRPGLLTVMGTAHVVPRLRKQFVEHLAYVAIIVYHKDGVLNCHKEADQEGSRTQRRVRSTPFARMGPESCAIRVDGL